MYPKIDFGTHFGLQNLSKIEKIPIENDVEIRHEKKSEKRASKSPKKKSTSLAPGSIWHPPLPQTPSPIKNIYTEMQLPSLYQLFPSSTDPLGSGVWELCFPSPFFPLPAQAENLGHL